MPYGYSVKNGRKTVKEIVFKYDSFAKILFCFEHITEQTVSFFLAVFLCRLKFQLQLFRNYRVTIDLSMWMRHGGSNHTAAVFKDKNIFDVFILADVSITLCPQVDQFSHVFIAELFEGGVVTWRIQDNFTFSVGWSDLEKVVCNVIWLRWVLGQGREVVVVFEHLIVVRYLSGTWTERTPVLWHLRAVLAVGVDHNPVLNEWVPAKFSHNKILLISKRKVVQN